MAIAKGRIDARAFNALNNKTQHIWNQLKTYPAGEKGIHLAGGITGTNFDYDTPDTWGFNTHINDGGIRFRYNQINLTELVSGGLTFYTPAVSSGAIGGSFKSMELTKTSLAFYSPLTNASDILVDSVKSMELTKDKLAFYKPRTSSSSSAIKMMELTNSNLTFYNSNGRKGVDLTTSALNFYDGTTASNVLAKYTGTEITIGKASDIRVTIDSNGIAFLNNNSTTQKIAGFSSTNIYFKSYIGSNSYNVFDAGALGQQAVYHYLYGTYDEEGTIPNNYFTLSIPLDISIPTTVSDIDRIGFAGFMLSVPEVYSDGRDNYMVLKSWTDWDSNGRIRIKFSMNGNVPQIDINFRNISGKKYSLSMGSFSGVYEDYPTATGYVRYDISNLPYLYLGPSAKSYLASVEPYVLRSNSSLNSNSLYDFAIDCVGNTFIKRLFLNNNYEPVGTIISKASTSPKLSVTSNADTWNTTAECEIYLRPGTYIVHAAARMETNNGVKGKYGIAIGVSYSNAAWSRYLYSAQIGYNDSSIYSFYFPTTTYQIRLTKAAWVAPMFYMRKGNDQTGGKTTVTRCEIRAIRIE